MNDNKTPDEPKCISCDGTGRVWGSFQYQRFPRPCERCQGSGIEPRNRTWIRTKPTAKDNF